MIPVKLISLFRLYCETAVKGNTGEFLNCGTLRRTCLCQISEVAPRTTILVQNLAIY